MRLAALPVNNFAAPGKSFNYLGMDFCISKRMMLSQPLRFQILREKINSADPNGFKYSSRSRMLTFRHYASLSRGFLAGCILSALTSTCQYSGSIWSAQGPDNVIRYIITAHALCPLKKGPRHRPRIIGVVSPSPPEADSPHPRLPFPFPFPSKPSS